MDFYRIDHIAQGVPELAPQMQLLEGLFGFRRQQGWQSTEDGVRGVRYEIPGTSGTCWELLAPLDESAPLQAFLDGPRGPGLHHVAVEVTDLAAASARLDRLGVPARSVEGSMGAWLESDFGPAEGVRGLPFRLYATPTQAASGSRDAPLDWHASGQGPDLGIAGLLHVCQAHPSRDAVARWYQEATGMRPIYRTPDGAWPDMSTLMLTVPGSPIIWEIIQPEGEDSHVRRYLERKGAGFHHVTFAVRDWQQAMSACAQHEVSTFGLSEGETDGARWCDAFIHPKQTGGVLVQLYWEERPGVWARSDKIPEPPRND